MSDVINPSSILLSLDMPLSNLLVSFYLFVKMHCCLLAGSRQINQSGSLHFRSKLVPEFLRQLSID